jgi:hypothetical protein
VHGQKFSSAVKATVIQSRQTETRRSNKCIEPIFTNKSQRVSKSAHWSRASRYDFLINVESRDRVYITLRDEILWGRIAFYLSPRGLGQWMVAPGRQRGCCEWIMTWPCDGRQTHVSGVVSFRWLQRYGSHNF